MSLMSVCERLSAPWLTWVVASSWQLALLVCLVAALARLLRHAPARLRYGLWLLVLIKVFLPPGLMTPWSVGRWGIEPLVEATGMPTTIAEALPVSSSILPTPDDDASENLPDTTSDKSRSETSSIQTLSARTILMFVWVGGMLCVWAAVGWRYLRVVQLIRAADLFDEGPAPIALAQIAIDLQLRRAPELRVTREATSPFLFGVFRPTIVLPETLLDRLSATDLPAVLTHELIHYQRRDTWIGWLQVVASSLCWFHPLVWWANRQLRHERECVCDEAVLRLGQVTPEQYGECIFQSIAASRGRSLVAGSLVGVFERGAKLQNRLEDVMNFKPASSKSTWATRLTLAVFAMLFLPMAPGAVSRLVVAGEENAKPEAATETSTPAPRIVKSSPLQRAIDVDPALTEITVTFDRDMGAGMSWTGGPPHFPPVDKGRKARWIDARTCSLPVKLEKGAYYRLGINSSSHRNFRGTDGVTAPPTTICFTTAGATEEIQRRLQPPKVAKFSPEQDATDVDPATASLQVSFDGPMGDGMSWVGSGPKYPTTPAGKQASWSKDRLTCTLPVSLEPGRDYELRINSSTHSNFQSQWGVPVEPVVYKFKTRVAKE